MRWTNQSLPPTLQITVLLLYITAFFGVLRGLISISHPLGVFLLFTGLIAFGGAAGIVRERKVGYWLAALYAVLDVVGEVLGMLREFSGLDLIGLFLAIALAGLLLHPMSRAYYSIWFR